jgi:hypothetical protein
MPAKTSRSTLLRRFVTTTLAVAALGVSAGVLAQTAQTAKEAALEARVAELERMVKQLMAEKQVPAAAAPAPAAAPAGSAPTTVAAAPTAKAPPPVQQVSIVPNAAAGTTFYFTGYAKADALWTTTPDGEIPDAASGREYYVPNQTPIGGDDEATDFDFHVKQTRLIAGTETPFSNGDKLRTHFEVDFFSSTLGTSQNITNAYSPVLRQAFFQTKHWLVGQAWSTFQDTVALPEAADFIGPTDGTVFVRQAQVRYTYGGFSIAAENPQTTIMPYRAGSTTQINSDDNAFPDLIGRYIWKGDWGSVTLAGLVRQLKYQTTGANPIDDSIWTAAGALSGKLNVFDKDDIRWMLVGGNLGRYVGLNFTTDAVLDADRELEAIDGFAGFIAYRHMWTETLRSSLYYAAQSYDNDENLTGPNANKASESWTVNLFYSPIPKLDIGAEYRWAKREFESGDDGTLNRVQLTSKYSF